MHKAKTMQPMGTCREEREVHSPIYFSLRFTVQKTVVILHTRAHKQIVECHMTPFQPILANLLIDTLFYIWFY